MSIDTEPAIKNMISSRFNRAMNMTTRLPLHSATNLDPIPRTFRRESSKDSQSPSPHDTRFYKFIDG